MLSPTPVSVARDDFRTLSDMVQRTAKPISPERLQMVAVLVLPNVVPFDLVIPDFVFGDTKPHGGVAYYRMQLCGIEPGLVPMVGGTPVGVSHGLEVVEAADTVVIPGRSPADTPVPEPVLHALRRAAERGARMVSICTGSFVLGAAGLLDGRRATTHWAHAENFSRLYPRVSVDPRVLYIEDGRVLTSAGMAAGIDLCLHVVRSDHGAEVANAIARRMVVPPHRTGGQAQFIQQPVPVTRDEALQKTQAWALEHLHEPITIELLAKHANMSPRHFARRFHAELGTAPLRWLLAERVRLAQRLLEQTDLSVQRIAERAGLGSAMSLRRHFARQVGTTPLDYRLVFRGAKPEKSRRS